MPFGLWDREKCQVSSRNMANNLEEQLQCCWTESRKAKIQRTAYFIHWWVEWGPSMASFFPPH